MRTKKMGKREAIAIIEATLRKQAATGTVSSKLVEQLVSIRGWSGKAKAARAKARAGKTVVQPSTEAAPLHEMIAAAREQEPVPPQPHVVSQPAPRPALQPHPQPSAVPPPVKRGALDLLLGIPPESPEAQPTPQVTRPRPSPEPRPNSVFPVSHLDIEERPVVVDHSTPPENGGDILYW